MQIHEGTTQELTSILAHSPQGRFRLIEIEEDQETAALSAEVTPAIDAENAAAIALLKSWREQDWTEDPDELRKAEEELGEFKRALNATRLSSGERPIFP